MDDKVKEIMEDARRFARACEVVPMRGDSLKHKTPEERAEFLAHFADYLAKDIEYLDHDEQVILACNITNEGKRFLTEKGKEIVASLTSTADIKEVEMKDSIKTLKALAEETVSLIQRCESAVEKMNTPVSPDDLVEMRMRVDYFYQSLDLLKMTKRLEEAIIQSHEDIYDLEVKFERYADELDELAYEL